MKNIMKNETNEKGQALIELIVFLPLMFTLYSVISGFASSINGSINQQKIARAYFYYRAQNNSTIPKPDADKVYQSWGRFGMFYIGWKDYFKGQGVPVMPCYRVSIPLKAANRDLCENTYTTETTLYVRVGTVYGTCGATFLQQGTKTFYIPDANGVGYEGLVDTGSCLISR